MLQLHGSSALESRHVAVCGESCGVPKSHRLLHTQLVLEGSQRGSGVVGPVTPRASRQAILAHRLTEQTLHYTHTHLHAGAFTCTAYTGIYNPVAKVFSSTEMDIRQLLSTKRLLEEHADDGHHGQTAVGNLSIQLRPFHLRVVRGDQLPSEVPSIGSRARGLVPRDLTEGHVAQDVCPASRWHLRDSSQTVGHIRELETRRRGQVTWKLPSDLRRHVAHGGQHGDASVLDFGGAPPLEVLYAAIC